jgi:PKD repeat protein
VNSNNTLLDMRPLLRSLFLITALALGGATFAQLQYWALVYGQVTGCTPGQVITVTSSFQTVTATVDPNCSYWVSVYTAANPDVITTSTPCQGAIQTLTSNVTFNSMLDSALVNINFNCGGGTPDCLGVPGGNAQPGTACTTVLGTPGTWSADCQCVPNAQNCQACFTVSSTAPWTASFVNCSSGDAPFTYQWWLPNGSASTSQDEDWTFTTEGVYGVCLTIADASGCTSVLCDTVFVDANGGISNDPVFWDCLQIANGPNMPGTPCTNPATGMTGTWSADCVCIPDTTGGAYDCLGVLNGSNLPGTPCWTPGTNFIGTWDANCNCTSGGGLPCQAGFWVIQAYGQDSLPVPNEVWVWNLSTGNGALTYLWNFGDGTTSTDPYPTHTYSQNGPYQLCLTIADASGCTSTTCDTISIDEDGLLNGMMIGGHVELDPARTDGFTLNIQNPLTTSMAELQDLSHAAIWPNPSNGDLDLALVSVADGPLRVSFLDVNGREVRQESRAMNAGRSQHHFDITDLPAGIYTLRATDRNGSSLSIRFVKAE